MHMYTIIWEHVTLVIKPFEKEAASNVWWKLLLNRLWEKQSKSYAVHVSAVHTQGLRLDMVYKVYTFFCDFN